MKKTMNSVTNTSRALGVAFLFQATTSLISGLILEIGLIVPGNINESMAKIARHSWLMRADILCDMFTAIGVIILGVILFATLRKQNETVALTATGLYLLEVALGTNRQITAFSLLRISQEYVTAGHVAYLQTIGSLASESIDFTLKLLMLPFCVGAILFYYLFYKSKLVPRALSLWGLVSVSLALAGTLFALSGYEVSFLVYLPYVPFEFAIGVWILVKGMNIAPRTEQL